MRKVREITKCTYTHCLWYSNGTDINIRPYFSKSERQNNIVILAHSYDK